MTNRFHRKHQLRLPNSEHRVAHMRSSSIKFIHTTVIKSKSLKKHLLEISHSDLYVPTHLIRKVP